MNKTLVLLALMASSVMADELVLKDGKRVEWVGLRDNGDTYEIETPAGTKVTVKKDDVDSLAKRKAPELLTGASVSFDKKRKMQTIDLVRTVDPKRDGVTGTWRANGGLFGQGGLNLMAKCQLSAFTDVPEEYDLTVDVVRREGQGELSFGLIGGGKQFQFVIDRLNSTWSGPWTSSGPEANGLGVTGKFLANGKPRSITFMVRRESFVVMVDGKDYLSWKAEWSQASMEPVVSVPMKNVLFVAAGDSAFQITRMVLTTPK